MKTVLGVHGIGMISVCGRGIESHADAYNHTQSADSSSPIRVCRVADEILKDRVALKKMRRADRFSKMSALAARDAIDLAGLRVSDGGIRLGIVVATAFGPHRATFEFLDEILDFGDAGVSPTLFSHSVHNAAAAYIAIMLGSRGPACTVTDFQYPFHAGLMTASVWLHEQRCSHVLVGYTEESSTPMDRILAQRHRGQPSHEPVLFNFSPYASKMFSEGSVFLVVTRPDQGGVALDLDRFKTGNDRISGLGSLWAAFKDGGLHLPQH